jgi:hydroxyacylglutathione hydrolase
VPDSPAPVSGDLAVRWHAGWPSAKHDPAPEIQVHHYTENTVLLRQNKSVHYEAPFLFLLFGADRALLLDTGATAEPEYFPLRRTVDELLGAWLRAHPRPGYQLIVAHTHGHGDHTAGDPQFAGRPDTTVVPAQLPGAAAYFGLTEGWPERTGEFDLGGRVLDLIPGPGHHPAAIVYYDRHTGLLFTGDSICRGRLYLFDRAAFTATVDRLRAFAATHPVSHVLGCHIEMRASGGDYPLGTTHQPDEPPLQLPPSVLDTVREGLRTLGDRPEILPLDDFVLYPVGPSS